MTAFRYVIVSIIGSLAGFMWAVVLVDFQPDWYERLPGWQAGVLLFMPIIIILCCSSAIKWWKGRACLIYIVTVLLWWAAGSISNELVNAGNLSHMSAIRLIGFHVTGAVLLAAGYGLGRLARFGFRRRLDAH